MVAGQGIAPCYDGYEPPICTLADSPAVFKKRNLVLFRCELGDLRGLPLQGELTTFVYVFVLLVYYHAP